LETLLNKEIRFKLLKIKRKWETMRNGIMKFDIIFECDYGNRAPVKELLKDLLKTYDANVMPLVCVFINNNPYSLELFVVLSLDTESKSLKGEIHKKFKSIGAKLRTDLTLRDLISAQGNRQFNSCYLVGPEDCEIIFETQFFFAEKKDLARKHYSTEPVKPSGLTFAAYSSADQDDIDKLVQILNRKSIPVWYDEHCIDYGESLTEKIQQAIKECMVVIFWVSKNFLNSNWCKTEMEAFLNRYASNRDILIITIKSEEVSHDDLPAFLKDLKYVDKAKFKTHEDIAEEITPTIIKHLRERRKPR
jgi:hypothetical protein